MKPFSLYLYYVVLVGFSCQFLRECLSMIDLINKHKFTWWYIISIMCPMYIIIQTILAIRKINREKPIEKSTCFTNGSSPTDENLLKFQMEVLS